MKINVNDASIAVLERVKNKVLMTVERRMVVLRDFTVETHREIRKSLFAKPHEVEKHYLVSAVLLMYNYRGRFLGEMNEEGCKQLLLYHDLDVMRTNWLNFQAELQAFDFQVVPVIKKDSDELATTRAAREFLKSYFRSTGYENEEDIVRYAVAFSEHLKANNAEAPKKEFNEETGIDYQ
jgi:hypothetical protein